MQDQQIFVVTDGKGKLLAAFSDEIRANQYRMSEDCKPYLHADVVEVPWDIAIGKPEKQIVFTVYCSPSGLQAGKEEQWLNLDRAIGVFRHSTNSQRPLDGEIQFLVTIPKAEAIRAARKIYDEATRLIKFEVPLGFGKVDSNFDTKEEAIARVQELNKNRTGIATIKAIEGFTQYMWANYTDESPDAYRWCRSGIRIPLTPQEESPIG